MPSSRPQRVQSLDRGLRILEYVAAQDEPVRLNDLARLLGVERSSAHRLAATLVDRDYLARDPDTSGYVLAVKTLALAGRLVSARGLHQHARRFLRDLAAGTGETAHLAVATSQGATFLDHEYGRHPIAATTRWGQSEPLHCTAIGKALLAGMSKGDIRARVGPGRLKAYTARTITRLDDLVRECDVIAATGVARDQEEYRAGMVCVAAPVYDFRGSVIAAIGISGPSERMRSAGAAKRERLVKNRAALLSREMGHMPPT